MTTVIKVGGRPQADPSLAARIARAAGSGAPIVLVHGGGDEVTALQSAFGVQPTFVDGRRVTTAADIDLVRMALSGSANKRLVAALLDAGVRAVGLSGEDGALIDAKPSDPARLGFVGSPARVNLPLLRLLLDAGYVPVLSPVSRWVATEPSDGAPRHGSALNVNGDDAAAAIAGALGASELLLVSDVPGVRDGEAIVDQLVPDELRALLAGDAVTGGMRAKLQAALRALEHGVTRVRISDLEAIDDANRGTVLVAQGVLV